ncbi:MAG: hypothetical protein M3Q29_26115 [Chloroflexota bacterium]|nr:hypothetical protein [Chloroflexota bacterium]
MYTLQIVDTATAWSERVAILGRSGRAVSIGLDKVLQRLPFEVKQLYLDNGPEFFNDHLIRYFGEEITGMKLWRSRGFTRTIIEWWSYVGQCRRLNEIYELMWKYYNVFQPVLQLVQKSYETGKLKSKWDEAKTPYQRLKDTKVLSEDTQARLDKLYRETNPRQLREQIYKLLCGLWYVQRDTQR